MQNPRQNYENPCLYLSRRSNVERAQQCKYCTAQVCECRNYEDNTQNFSNENYQTKQITSGMKCNLPDMLVAIQETYKPAFAAIEIRAKQNFRWISADGGEKQMVFLSMVLHHLHYFKHSKQHKYALKETVTK